MEFATTLYDHLHRREPFCFSKFNDGEQALLSPWSVASRGHQATSDLLRVRLFEALIYTHPRYYLGLPCPNCNSAAHTGASTLRYGSARMPPGAPHANVLINCNVGDTVRTLKEALPSYPSVHLVVADGADVATLERELGLTFGSVLRVPADNGFDAAYPLLKNASFQEGACVLLCCGPLGRVLAHEWFRASGHRITCLELGSLFDPVSQNKAYMYHYGGLGPCPHCNPRPDHGGAFTSYITASTEVEHWYVPLATVINQYRVPAKSMVLYFGRRGMEYERRLALCFAEVLEDRARLLRAVHGEYPDRWEAGLYLYEMTREWEILADLMGRPLPPMNEHTDRAVYDWRVYSVVAVEAWYNQRKDLGKIACEKLLEPTRPVPDDHRDMARRNISYYE